MLEKRKVIVCRGIQGSGKSTWAKQYIHDNGSDKWVRFNNDDIRNMLGDYWVPSREKLVTALYTETVSKAIAHGYNIIIDNMNLNPKTIKEIEVWVGTCNSYPLAKYEYEIEYMNFPVTLQEAIERDKWRDQPIGEKIITDTYNRYKEELESWIKQ